MIETFEFWYAKVSRGGRTMTRRKTSPYIVKAHRRQQIQKNVKKARLVDLIPGAAAASTTNFDDEDADDEEDEARIKKAVAIKKMKVKDLRAECTKLLLNESGLKSELQQRLLQHCQCKDIRQEVTRGKHKCKWERKQYPAPPTPFTDDEFNATSLKGYLPSFPDAVPSPGEC